LIQVKASPARPAACAERDNGLGSDRILPTVDEWQVAARVAAATAATAQSDGVAQLSRSPADVFDAALERIRAARDATASLMRDGFISSPPG
jgi:malic enzyme